MEPGNLQLVPIYIPASPHLGLFCCPMEGGSSCRPHPSGAQTRVAFPAAGFPWGEAAPGVQPEPDEPRRRGGQCRCGARCCSCRVRLPITFPSTLPISYHALWRGDREEARKAPKASPADLSSCDGGPQTSPHPTHLAQPPGGSPGRPRRGSQQSSGSYCICWRPAAGGGGNRGTDKKPG